MHAAKSSPDEPHGVSRKAELSIKMAEFEIPPMQDVLLVGRKAPIGPEAVRRMVDALTPDQYVILHLDHRIFEAVVLRKSLLTFMPQEKLVPILLEEASRVASEYVVIKAQVSVIIQVKRAVDL
ncbi:hypothetical protein [Desulfovirgula thermocuniculi]|uniref:hypothetical protein n=1 Tax=Desulfovirgula thermocuniculi TaxID=348842 RepID=UPI0004268B98|nr:hypothetical protein [Desulfovirgula thermocuniculi]